MTPHELTLSQIDRIAFWHEVGIKDVLSKDRRLGPVAARRDVAVYYRHEGKTFQEIGRILGRDHTTVLNLVYGKGWKKRTDRNMTLPRRAGYSAGLI
jgi:chromosomal replication initiation ATPase DnaA